MRNIAHPRIAKLLRRACCSKWRCAILRLSTENAFSKTKIRDVSRSGPNPPQALTESTGAFSVWRGVTRRVARIESSLRAYGRIGREHTRTVGRRRWPQPTPDRRSPARAPSSRGSGAPSPTLSSARAPPIRSFCESSSPPAGGTRSKSGTAASSPTIRGNLLDASAPYPLARTEVFLQGSYKNDTNVYGDSDVDIVLCHTGAYFSDLTRLSPEDRRAYDAAPKGTVTYGYNDFKRDATDYITRLYSNVSAGKKALYIPGGNSGRRNADVLIAFEFRRYYEFKSWANQRYDEGVCFFPAGGSMIENFPKLHADNCTTKHQNTRSYFKPMVRIFKNMRNTMIVKGLLAVGVAPSYFVEGMLYNVPSDKFTGSYQDMWVACFNWIVTADETKLTTANRMHWLVRDNDSVSWPTANFRTFMAALRDYWES